MHRIRRPSHATVVAYLALFAALGGGAYAALSLPANSVGRRQLRNDSVSSSKIKDGTLKARDFKAGALPAGPAGARGPAGAAGADGARGRPGLTGTARAYAIVHPTCTGTPAICTISKSKDVLQVVRRAAGDYCVAVSGIDSAGTPAVASTNLTYTVAPEEGGVVLVSDSSVGCPSATDFHVITRRLGLAGGVNDVGFQILIP